MYGRYNMSYEMGVMGSGFFLLNRDVSEIRRGLMFDFNS